MTVPGLRSVSGERRASALLAAALAAAFAGCGSTGASTRSTARHSGAHTTTAPRAPELPAHLIVTPVATLPAPVQAPATTAVGDRAILIGGLDQADVSVPDVVAASDQGAQRIATLPIARHDAAAATLAGRAYVIGGGEPSFDQIDAVGAGAISTAGALPAAASDVAAATVGSAIYVVGGFTGTVPLDTVVAWTGSGTGRVVAHLPQPLRYAAVAVRRQPADHRRRHERDGGQQRCVRV